MCYQLIILAPEMHAGSQPRKAPQGAWALPRLSLCQHPLSHQKAQPEVDSIPKLSRSQRYRTYLPTYVEYWRSRRVVPNGRFIRSREHYRGYSTSG